MAAEKDKAIAKVQESIAGTGGGRPGEELSEEYLKSVAGGKSF